MVWCTAVTGLSISSHWSLSETIITRRLSTCEPQALVIQQHIHSHFTQINTRMTPFSKTISIYSTFITFFKLTLWLYFSLPQVWVMDLYIGLIWYEHGEPLIVGVCLPLVALLWKISKYFYYQWSKASFYYLSKLQDWSNKYKFLSQIIIVWIRKCFM